MPALEIRDAAPVVASAPNRTDIACFVGFVARRKTSVPDELRRWLSVRGWLSAPYRPSDPDSLLNLPVPLLAFEIFDRLFVSEARPLNGRGQTATAYLAAAVRSFFAQGGRKCYVVRVGDPWVYDAPRTERMAALQALLPGYDSEPSSSPLERRSWAGAGHLFGLPDVSILCFPDVADAVRPDDNLSFAPLPFPILAEQFTDCSAEEPEPPKEIPARLYRAPRSDRQGYLDWAKFVNGTTNFLRTGGPLREVLLVTAIPIPRESEPAGSEPDPARHLMTALATGESPPFGAMPSSRSYGISSAFVQTVYPWVKTPGSTALPEQLEPPEGALTGIMARNALTRGTFRSLAGQEIGDIYDLSPLLTGEALDAQVSYRALPEDGATLTLSHSLTDRATLFGRTPGGLTLLSDTTTSLDELWRPAGVSRLVGAILRAARACGEETVFEPNGERLWSQLRERLNTLLTQFLQEGALQGATPAEAFEVRCDGATMTQNDLDAGRLIVYATIFPAASVERILVTLNLQK